MCLCPIKSPDSVRCADRDELTSMAAAFAQLPCQVLWRLTRKEAPDAAALAALHLGNNTQVVLGIFSTL